MLFPSRSSRWLWAFCLCWAVSQNLGCDIMKKEARYPADYARYQRIAAALETLQKAYASKDQKTIHGLLLPLDELDRLEREIQKDFETYAIINLDFSVERIVIDGNTIEMYVHWQGQWRKTPADDGVRERGHGMLRWVGVYSILLSSVEGDLPFGMATRQATTSTPEPPKPATP